MVRGSDSRTSFSVNHGFSTFKDGRIGSDGSTSEAVNGRRVCCGVGGSEVSLEDIFKTRSR